jgi:hypothetical protein
MSFEEWYDQHFGSADPNVVKAGNIDLGDRPAVYNEDGTVSTEQSFSIGDEYGRETLIPQVVGGKMLSKKDAIKHYKETGEHLGIYKDIPTATAYADAIHNRTPRLDTPETFPAGNLFQSVRDLPGWAAYRMYRGATRNDLPGEGPSAREQEAAGVVPPPYQRGSFSIDNARANLRDIKNAILPPGFSAQRGLDSALAPAKWLFNEVRQQVLPDEAIEEIKRDPYSVNSLGAYLNAAISLSGGKGGREVPMGPRPVPRRVWDMWKPTDNPGVKVDETGTQYKATGTHYDKNTGESHIVVDPIVTDIPSPQDTLISDLAKQAGNNPTTWDQLSSWQKQWFEQQWKLGNTPGMKDVPPDPGLPTPQTGEAWHDNPYQKFLEGTFPTEELKPQEEAPPDDSFQQFLDKTYPQGTSGQFPDPETLPPGELSKPEPPKPEPGSVLDEWMKKHGGQNPFSEPTPSNPFTDYEAPPSMPKPPDRGPLGPLEPDIIQPYESPWQLEPYNPRNPPEFPKPPEQIIKEQSEGIQSDIRKIMEWEKGLANGDITQAQYDAAVDAIRKGELPPLPPSKPNPVPDWWKPPDEGVQKDFDYFNEWQRKMQQNKNRFNWKPPEHGGNNL